MSNNNQALNSKLPQLVKSISEFHYDRNLIDGANDHSQCVKLLEEAGELAASILRGRDVSDDIGDIIVVLINIAERNGLTLEQCLKVAYDEIKDRKGRMINGSFVKETDL